MFQYLVYSLRAGNASRCLRPQATLQQLTCRWRFIARAAGEAAGEAVEEAREPAGDEAGCRGAERARGARGCCWPSPCREAGSDFLCLTLFVFALTLVGPSLGARRFFRRASVGFRGTLGVAEL